MTDPKAIQLLRDVETEVNISGIISNHTYAEIVKTLEQYDRLKEQGEHLWFTK